MRKPVYDGYTHSNFHSLTSDKLHGAHHILLHLDQLRELLREIWAKSASGGFAECMAYTERLACNVVKKAPQLNDCRSGSWLIRAFSGLEAIRK